VSDKPIVLTLHNWKTIDPVRGPHPFTGRMFRGWIFWHSKLEDGWTGQVLGRWARLSKGSSWRRMMILMNYATTI
jgi:hypothetical protein